ncbi:MAG: sulfur carrier protein ThiS [Thermomicrobiales bacterium]|nr:sulfur carrier protein ThiS [Thermomicrobiales bacterium]
MQHTNEHIITLTLNGRPTEVAPGTSLGKLLDDQGIIRRMIAIEYNGEILPRHRYDETILGDGDELEVVQMVGGG